MMLSALKGNPALEFYKRLGFKVIGEGAYEHRVV